MVVLGGVHFLMSEVPLYDQNSKGHVQTSKRYVCLSFTLSHIHLSIFLEREFFIDNLLVRIHFIIALRWWILAPWELRRSLF